MRQMCEASLVLGRTAYWSVNCRMQIFAHPQNFNKHDFERCKLGAAAAPAPAASAVAASAVAVAVAPAAAIRRLVRTGACNGHPVST